MKKLALILALILLAVPAMARQQKITGLHRKIFTAAGGHSFTVVHSYECDNNANNATGTVTCALTATTSGNGLMAVCLTTGSTLSSTTPTLASVGTGAVPSSYFMQPFLTSPVTTGTVAATFSGGGTFKTVMCIVSEIAGVNSTTNIDPGGSAIANPTRSSYGTGGSTSVTGSVTTTNSNDTICAYVQLTSGTPITAGTGYTIALTGTISSGGINISVECRTTILSATTTENPGYTWTGGQAGTVGTFSIQLQ